MHDFAQYLGNSILHKAIKAGSLIFQADNVRDFVEYVSKPANRPKGNYHTIFVLNNVGIERTVDGLRVHDATGEYLSPYRKMHNGFDRTFGLQENDWVDVAIIHYKQEGDAFVNSVTKAKIEDMNLTPSHQQA